MLIIKPRIYLDSFFVILDVISVNVVMGTNRLLKLGTDNVTGTLGSRTAGKQHNTSTGILEGSLKQAHRHTECNTCASESSLVIRNRPWVTLQLL